MRKKDRKVLQPSEPKSTDAITKALYGDGGFTVKTSWPSAFSALTTVSKARTQAGEGSMTPIQID